LHPTRGAVFASGRATPGDAASAADGATEAAITDHAASAASARGGRLIKPVWR